MTKLHFTPPGFTNACEMLYQMDDAALPGEACAVAEDFISWTACHFELEVHLLDSLRNLPKNFCFSWAAVQPAACLPEGVLYWKNPQ